MSRFLFGAAFGLLLAGHTSAETIPADGLVLRSGVAISSVSRAGRAAFHTDPVEAAIVAGNWKTPRAGDTLLLTGGTNKTWEAVNAGPDGSFTNAAAMRGGYLGCTVRLDAPQIVLLNATGHGLVYVNGEPHAGDTYQWGINSFPVQMRAGDNEFLFLSGRGRVRAELRPAKAPLAFHLADMTLPDLLAGERNDVQGAVIIVNSTTNFVRDGVVRAAAQGGKAIDTTLPSIPPLSTRKVPFRMVHPGRSNTNQVPVALTLSARSLGGRKALDATNITLRLRGPAETFKTTFLSAIDGSLQYYAVRPAVPAPAATTRPALFLSLHGASVEAMGQADAYSPKSWGIFAAPTNRRPYGFDWEDWGRRDAIEVLDLAQARFKTDPRRVYLTGHSMGGHGTWQVGVTYPDRFAALGPSAGWISFWSYAGARREENPGPARAMFDRALGPSDTLALATNYTKQGIYILHGDKDDNVPVTQARTMREELGKFHHDFMWHEQPGAGHWWDSSDEPGAECMDWPPMYDLFARHQLPPSGEVRDVNFSTANPGVSATCNWLTIHAQTKPLVKSSVNIRFDPGQRRFTGTTENVACLALDVAHAQAGGAFKVELDRQTLTNASPAPGQSKLWFKRDGDQWQAATAPGADRKGPHRYGPFKEAFGHRMMFVYATRGTPEENAWALAKARFDAETFWYRGNGAVDVVPDHAFDARREPDRGVILYGNADNNSAWPALLGQSPVQVRRGVASIGGKELRGDDLACLFLRPRPGSNVACVAVVGGTGPAGLRLTDRAAYFTSGVAYPDCAVFDSETLTKGFDGVRAAGFFGNDWSIAQGEFVWRD